MSKVREDSKMCRNEINISPAAKELFIRYVRWGLALLMILISVWLIVIHLDAFLEIYEKDAEEWQQPWDEYNKDVERYKEIDNYRQLRKELKLEFDKALETDPIRTEIILYSEGPSLIRTDGGGYEEYLNTVSVDRNVDEEKWYEDYFDNNDELLVRSAFRGQAFFEKYLNEYPELAPDKGEATEEWERLFKTYGHGKKEFVYSYDTDTWHVLETWENGEQVKYDRPDLHFRDIEKAVLGEEPSKPVLKDELSEKMKFWDFKNEDITDSVKTSLFLIIVGIPMSLCIIAGILRCIIKAIILIGLAWFPTLRCEEYSIEFTDSVSDTSQTATTLPQTATPYSDESQFPDEPDGAVHGWQPPPPPSDPPMNLSQTTIEMQTCVTEPAPNFESSSVESSPTDEKSATHQASTSTNSVPKENGHAPVDIRRRLLKCEEQHVAALIKK